MDRAKFLAAAAALLLAACDVHVGKEADTDETAAKTEKAEGGFSIDVPGFAMNIDIPDNWREDAEIESDSDIIPPGSKMSGVHIRAGRAGSEDGVELRFTTPDAPAKVAQWYRDDARTDTLTVASVDEDGGAFTIKGTEKDDGDPFTVELSQADAGGTAGRLMLRDRK